MSGIIDNDLTAEAALQNAVQDEARQQYAGIDLGSNSFHLVLARRLKDQLQIIDRLRDVVRLGAGLDEHGDLTPEAQARALASLERFGQRIRGLPPQNVRAVGTFTLRQARNSRPFLERAAAALGHHIEVVSGQEEARLIYAGVSFHPRRAAARRLVFDIGGGSSELALGRGPAPAVMESLYMGCISYTRRFFGDGRITLKRWTRAEMAASLELQPIKAQFLRHGWDEAIGTSGSIRTAGSVLAAQGWSDGRITLQGLERLREALLLAGHPEKLTLKGISRDRATIFAGAVVILRATFQALNIGSMGIAEGALREGLLAELAGPVRQMGVCEQTVNNLQVFYHVDQPHAAQVAATAGYLYEQVAMAWQLHDPRLKEMLLWAAQLHEIGLAVSHSGYHKHGHYLLSHSDMNGFSQDMQDFLALLVRSHRRSVAFKEFRTLLPAYQGAAQALVVLLRLAVLLHRARADAACPPLQLEAGPQTLAVGFPAGWLEANPLTRADLELEARYLRAHRFSLDIRG